MKNLYVKFVAIFILTLLVSEVRAQQVPLFNQYYYAGNIAYPSSNVFEENRYLHLVFRDQFGGLIGSPKNFALSYNGAVRGRTAFSANITTADIGFTSQVKISGGIGYKLLGEGNDGLSLGTQVGLSFFSLNEDRVNPENPVDNVLIDLLGQNGSSLSFDFTASYRRGKLGIDIAVPTVINESLSDDAYIQINDDNVPDFIGGARYEFSINPDLTFTPYVGVRLRETIGAEVDVMSEIQFRDKFRATLGYRDNYGVTAGVGVQLLPKLLFTYNYDFGQKDAPFLADGFNEFGLHLQLNKKEDREDACIAEGKAVVEKIIQDRIFDENLVNPEDKANALCYLSSLEEGKRKEMNLKAEEAYKALFLKIKQEEMDKQEAARVAALAAEKERKEAETKAELERPAEIERLRLRELDRLARLEEEKIEKALSLAQESIAFNSGSATLTESSFAALDALATLMKENAGILLKLSGYTDSSGNAATNLRLSKDRAAAVKSYIVSQGIAEGRLEAEGYGISNPRADNSTAEGRALNRRVEMEIVRN
ncbi:MAG: PorP/SprF family type IX secretion system membrane protein [Roseivirga sp.]|nr:PorP/SprF family type IX secretion system membrane protein [Roseivirga sp.]